MTQRSDIERVLDLWLAEGPTQVPDRVFDAAIARVDRQPQPSAWRSRWRTSDMTPIRLIAAAIAVIAIVGVGLVVLRPGPGIGAPPTGTVSPSPSPSSIPTSSPFVSGAERLPRSGPIEPGRYFIADGTSTPMTFSFTVPAGWHAGGSGISQHPDESGREIGFGVAIVDGVFADPCGANEPVTAGVAAQDLLNALGERPGLDVRPATPIEIDGRAGQLVELAVEADVDIEACDPPIGLQVWRDRGDTYLVVGPEVVTRVHTVDLAGERFVLVTSHGLSADPAEIAELAAIIESIRFEQ